METAVYDQQANLSDSPKTPWVSWNKSPLLMSLELCRLPSPETWVLCSSESFPRWPCSGSAACWPGLFSKQISLSRNQQALHASCCWVWGHHHLCWQLFPAPLWGCRQDLGHKRPCVLASCPWDGVCAVLGAAWLSKLVKCAVGEVVIAAIAMFFMLQLSLSYQPVYL